MTGDADVPSGETRPDISIGRDPAGEVDAAKAEDAGSGHPLPASEKAKHGSIPESVEARKGHGAN